VFVLQPLEKTGRRFFGDRPAAELPKPGLFRRAHRLAQIGPFGRPFLGRVEDVLLGNIGHID
jgi:hypothetical protein